MKVEATAFISRATAFISYIAFMRIHEISLIFGTPLERRAPENYANPRYKCAEISDGDPIGDKNVNEAPAPESPILEPCQDPNSSLTHPP